MLSLRLGRDTVRVADREASVQRLVHCAYLVGGYRLVQDVDTQLVALQAQYRRTLQDLATADTRRRQIAERSPSLVNWATVAAEADDLRRRTGEELAEAARVRTRLHDAWDTVVAAEAAALAVFESTAVAEFQQLLSEAGQIAQKEWERYDPQDPQAPTARPLSAAEARERGADTLTLRHERAGVIGAAYELKQAAADYAEAREHVQRRIVPEFSHRARQDPVRQLAFAEAGLQKEMLAFERTRARIGGAYPVALQVYGQLGNELKWHPALRNAEREREIETWAIQALNETRLAVPELQADAQRLRLFAAQAPLQQTGDDGLSVPASRAVIERLASAGFAARSAWLQRPVRHRLRERALGLAPSAARSPARPDDEAMETFFMPGRLGFAALAEIDDEVKDLREAQARRQDRLLLLMDAIAVPLAFFTAGKSVLLAGVVHAAVRGREMGVAVDSWFAQSALAGASYAVVQECLWEHPSSLELAATLIEGGLEIGSDVLGGRVGAALDALQVVIAAQSGAQALARWLASPAPLGVASKVAR
jgi:hypothetical protein